MNVAIIGAGASGLMAAYAAASNGNKVTVFEKNEKSGKKIYITGKGRCNLTHDCSSEQFLENVVNNAKFLFASSRALSPHDTMKFFEDGGLPLKTERGGRVFPISDKASDVTRCLEDHCKSFGVEFKFNEKVLKISCLNSTVSDIITEKSAYKFDKAIICTGGVSYPSTGSTGDGYKFAEMCGHNVISPVQALCGINLKGDYFGILQGLNLKNVALNVYYGGKPFKSFFGEALFTHFGISGPIILTASSYINRLDYKKLKLCLDFKPALTDEQLDRRLLRDFEAYSNKSISNCLKSLLPNALIGVVLAVSNVDSDKKVNSVTKAERLGILTTVKNFDILFGSLRGFDEAVVTSGGVDVRQVNPKTMESKLVKGLYFCGEVLDCDALTGGYNLQIAFSTGYAAGISIIG